MKEFVYKALLFVAVIFLTKSSIGQNQLDAIINMGTKDMAAIKQKAVAGDASAQVTLGNTLAVSFHATEALGWYRKAAAQGNVEAEYQIGNMLLFGALGIPDNLKVHSNPIEGIRWTFMAATNFSPYACWNMSKALQRGLGTGTNLVAAYAWLKLFADTPSGSIVGRVELNQLALKLDSTALKEAEQLAAKFKARHWLVPVVRAFPEGDPRLKLSGIIFGTKNPLAVINGKTLSEGESARIILKSGVLTIKCLRIEKELVTVSVEGEDEPRLLRMK